ncbi:YciI family protein [Serinicoccus kebangsaanensis]|uniref:YciI family protein n=1 Tax=Serinicoccus kebangsaanensis TaxID=2602069 RepID=UPI00124DBB85|nr:YciI family protein [Serinicoccus kebangsaanensis]
MKYVILIQSNPQPWGHPTSDYLPAYQHQSQETRDRANADFEDMLGELGERGELVGGEALGDPATSRLFRWADGDRVVSDGPYAEGKEHLAGFFLIDVESQERAEQIAEAFSGPGETVELRPVMGGGGDVD